MSKLNNIFLVGPMGAGKTSVGRRLAKHLKLPFQDADEEIVKAADKICAYIKCLEEAVSGNREFSKAEEALRAAVEEIKLPEVEYFLKTFIPSFRLTLDELS